ncbi:MAG: helix-turn-helix transcriptional regulator [Planctomycetaceae bacterium]
MPLPEVPSGAQAAPPRAVDHAVIDLLRVDDGLGIGGLASSLGVTATAVRQRLDRLMRQGLVERSTTSGRRGRPSHTYRLTESGRRIGGDNFHDLAIVLWREIRSVSDAEVRRGLIGRIGTSLAGLHRDEVRGATPRDRLRDVAALMRRNQIACVVEEPAAGRDDGARTPSGEVPRGGLPVLTSYACPYPDLAEQDRGICAAERVMIEELVGRPVRLAECRLDGGSCCRFSMAEAGPDGVAGGGGVGTLRAEATPRRMPSERPSGRDPRRGRPSRSSSNPNPESVS